MNAILEVKDLVKSYQIRGRGVFGKRSTLQAVNGINLTVNRGEILGVVGESGCGKSTLARILIALEEPTSGEVLFNGEAVHGRKTVQRKQMARRIQMIFQDPYASLDPRRTVAEIIGEAFEIHKELLAGRDRDGRIVELLDLVGLGRAAMHKFPHQFSGGQRQRIGIARALAVEPEMLVCDEPVSALDVSIRAQIINLLMDLKTRLGLTIVFIAHDLDIVRHVSDRIVTMYLGKIVEEGTCDDVYLAPAHPYTKALLSAAPSAAFDGSESKRIVLKGDPPSPVDPPAGCHFNPRCWMATQKCREVIPVEALLENSHRSLCHYADEVSEKEKVPLG